ncbi:YbjN domain-containing protein [Aureimonas jatrophae]|jgi:hypothetical protein|uniref:Putative sensory transduction regulator n=1 Tax=Aureimonas jatrophae TaxID=1166073 RepID=A0A1H0CEW1_9HYPH|nr:YbjN domain-containing protein [Aureimonas jatrophae]MBB3949204.1 hypothetical protein [Aureimonas jatrophae]SDN56400.1 Putative sensory transduction regulator [Aureimonas jatrophae]
MAFSMCRWLPLVAILVTSSAPALAAAPALVDGTDPAVVMELMRGYGSARPDKGQDGNPMIRGRIDGNGFSAFFYDCDGDGANCGSIGLSAYFDRTDVSLDAINGWNRANRFGRVYLRDDGKPVIEMDIELAGGITADNFEAAMDRWSAILQDFDNNVVNAERQPEAGDVTP